MIRSLSVGEDRLGEDAAQLGLDHFEGEPWSGLRDPAPLRSSERPDAEAELFGVLDGKVLVGEVKASAAEFSKEQVTRDTDLSRKLGADAHILARD